MPNSPKPSTELERRSALERELEGLIVRYGGTATPDLNSKIVRCLEQIADALGETSTDSKSLSPLDVVRIRLGKFAASLTPPAVFRDPVQLAALRAELHEMACAFVGEAGSEGSRFLPGKRK